MIILTLIKCTNFSLLIKCTLSGVNHPLTKTGKIIKKKLKEKSA